MSAFTSKIILMGIGCRLCELDAPVNQLLNPGRGFLDNEFHDLFFTQAAPANQRVADVLIKAVLFIGYGGDATLRVIGVGFGFFFFGNDGYSAER